MTGVQTCALPILVECDSWDMMEKSQDRYFMGEYMPEYSWAEVTLSYLIQKFDEIEAQKTGVGGI